MRLRCPRSRGLTIEEVSAAVLHSSFPIALYILGVTALLGACLGSFLHCAAWRHTHGEQVWRGRSHCPACGHTLGAAELVPVLSWLALGGKCRWCKAPISAKYPAAEGVCALVAVSVVVRWDVSWQAAEYLVLGCILFFLSLVDLETMELPGLPMAVAAVSWLLFLPAHPQPWERLAGGLAGGLALGGGMLAVALMADCVLGRESMGGGDIKLLALLGLYFGPAQGLLLLILSCVVGLALAFAMGAKDRPFPFGPAIALAAWPVALFGEQAVGWYFNLF